MSEEELEESQESTPEEPQDDPQGEQPDVDWKAMARKWEKRAKENLSAAEKLKEFEDAQKTEQERLAEELEAARSKEGELSRKMLRLDVALAKAPEGMSAQKIRKLAARLTGDTVEELEADAEELFAEFAGVQTGAGGKPTPKLTGNKPSESSPNRDELVKQVLAKQRGY